MKTKILLLLLVIPQFLFAQSYYRNWVVKPNTQKEKIALIVANNYYENGGNLNAPIPTAKKLANNLKNHNIDVMVGHDLNRTQFLKIISDFSNQLKHYKSGIVFYLGHGFQIQGENYLIPIDANPDSKLDVEVDGVNINYLLRKMNFPEKPKIVFLDACRDNPFKKKWDSENRGFLVDGFNVVTPPQNTEIFYTTQKDSKVHDGNPYMEYFMEELSEGGCIDDIVRRISKRIYKQSIQQVPATYGQLLDEVCFKKIRNPEKENMILVRGGNYTMGCTLGDVNCDSDENPYHNVLVDDFYISKYEVTNTEYADFLNANGNKIESGVGWIDITDKDCKIEYIKGKYISKIKYINHPVVEVTWYGAMAYAQWKDARLPTEAEWEYAARSCGQNQKWAGTSSEINLDKYANICDSNCEDIEKKAGQDDGYVETSPVGSFAPNQIGIYDMSGNVWEWCFDSYDSSFYEISSEQNPVNIGETGSRVLRGGSWDSSSNSCRTSDRGSHKPTRSDNSGGFRIVYSVD